MEALFKDYPNPLLIHFLEFGFPLGILGRSNLHSDPYNHHSAQNYPHHVDYYLQMEISHKAIWGPYASPPLEGFHTSLFLSRPKPNSDHQRMIVDLMAPGGRCKFCYLCSNLSYHRSKGPRGCRKKQ